jgi:hypothetical protein
MNSENTFEYGGILIYNDLDFEFTDEHTDEHTNVQECLDDLIRELEPPTEPQIDVQYLDRYPVIITDDDGRFMRWYPSITGMLQTMHGSEGMNSHVIYRACNTPEWQKCYGKIFRWDPLMYVRYELISTSGHQVIRSCNIIRR